MTSRRSYLKSVSALTAGTAAGIWRPLLASSPSGTDAGIPNRKVHIFSKHLQWLGYEKMAQTAEKTGFDGVDLTVRPKGHVLPENVKKDLPEAIKAIRDQGLIADRMTTAITSADDPYSRDILETAAREGLKYYRMGWFAYQPGLPVSENIAHFRSNLTALAALNRELGLQGAYQNHAGEMAGGPVWDMGLMLEGVDPDHMGVRYDIRHATVEGGQSWPLGMKYLASRINSFDVKDFIWKQEGKMWKPHNLPLGQGMVDFERYFRIIREQKIHGDFTLHLEYPIGGAEHGDRELSAPPVVVTTAMEKDLQTLRNFISAGA